MAKHRTRLPAFPTMYGFSEPLERAGQASDKAGFEFFLWGQGAALNRELPAAELVQRLVDEAQVALQFARGSSEG